MAASLASSAGAQPRKTDIRALGVIMYELLTGMYPYDPENKLSDPGLMKAIEYNNRRGDAKQEYKNLSVEAKDLIDSL